MSQWELLMEPLYFISHVFFHLPTHLIAKTKKMMSIEPHGWRVPDLLQCKVSF